MEVKPKMKEANFQIGDMVAIGLTLVVTGIGIAFYDGVKSPQSKDGLDVMADVQDDMTADSVEYNATGNAIEGVSKLPEKMPTIATEQKCVSISV